MANRFVNAFKALVGTEGSWRGSFTGQGELGNSFTLDPLADGWQQNLHVNKSDAKNVPAVYASVMLIARAISHRKHRNNSRNTSSSRSSSPTNINRNSRNS